MYYKTLFITTFVFSLFIGLSNIQVVAQSDFQTVRSYQVEYNAILEAVQALEISDEAQAIIQRINRFETDYGDQADLINRFIHPETFQDRLNALRRLASAANRNLQTIEERGTEINTLNRRVSDLSDQLGLSNQRADSLRQALQEMTRDRNANAAMVRNLRNELQKRDEFILNLVDSLFIAYDNIDIISIGDGNQRDFTLSASPDNVIGHISSVVESNINFLDTNTRLSSVDYLQLQSNLVDFKSVWTKLGPRLADVYETSAERAPRLREVDVKIEAWEERLSQSLWRSLGAAFSSRNIGLGNFNSSSTFYQALNNYIDDAMVIAEEEGGSEETLLAYNTFADVWHNDVKLNWQSSLVDGRLLSLENIATIDRKLVNWNLAAQPTGFNWLIIVGLLGLAVLVLAVLLLSRGKSASA